MAEGVNRYSPSDLLNRQHAAQYEQQKPDVWTACAWASQELAAEWVEKMGKHGPPERHFSFHVRNARIVLACLTPEAYGWARIQRMARDPACLAYDHAIDVMRSEAR